MVKKSLKRQDGCQVARCGSEVEKVEGVTEEDEEEEERVLPSREIIVLRRTRDLVEERPDLGGAKARASTSCGTKKNNNVVHVECTVTVVQVQVCRRNEPLSLALAHARYARTKIQQSNRHCSRHMTVGIFLYPQYPVPFCLPRLPKQYSPGT